MIKDYFEESISVKKSIIEDQNLLNLISGAIDLLKGTFISGKKILIAGNGGSAADAQHMAAEIVGRYKKERRGYPAIALNANTSILTAWSNDYDFKTVFERQVGALGQPGDVFIGISTSGNSENIARAVLKSKEMGIKTICLLGNKGGNLGDMCDIPIIVPSSNTPRIQEAHIAIIHSICEEVEKDFEAN